MDRGFIYILKPEPSESVLKIGRSIHPELRFNQHRQEWRDLEVLCVFEAIDHKELESDIHRNLKEFRVGKRELFGFCDSSVFELIRMIKISLFSVSREDWQHRSFSQRANMVEGAILGVTRGVTFSEKSEQSMNEVRG